VDADNEVDFNNEPSGLADAVPAALRIPNCDAPLWLSETTKALDDHLRKTLGSGLCEDVGDGTHVMKLGTLIDLLVDCWVSHNVSEAAMENFIGLVAYFTSSNIISFSQLKTLILKFSIPSVPIDVCPDCCQTLYYDPPLQSDPHRQRQFANLTRCPCCDTRRYKPRTKTPRWVRERAQHLHSVTPPFALHLLLGQLRSFALHLLVAFAACVRRL
jgi:hypothetical protein